MFKFNIINIKKKGILIQNNDNVKTYQNNTSRRGKKNFRL